jgi:hypothetical protein
LVELLRFYSIRASDLTSTFENDDDTESESSSSGSKDITLEEAVKANPTLALAHLAARLGLDYHSIHTSMGLSEQIQAAKAQQETQQKRDRSVEKDDTGPKKKAIIEAVQAYRASSDIPVEALVACPNEFQSEPSPAAAAVSSLSSPSTKSTVPFSHTPSVVVRATRYGALAPAIVL